MPAPHATTDDATAGTSVRPALHASVLDAIGQQIVWGVLEPHAVLRIDQLDQQYRFSRSVVREAVRVLDSM